MELTKLPTTVLLDMLAEKTREMTQLLADKEFGPGYDECKKELAELMSEIESRKQREKLH